MRIILLIIMIALFAGCGTSKRVLKTDVTTTSNTETKKVDTTVTTTGLEEILTTVANQVDMSKIQITTYYPLVDSVTGKQPIRSEIVIDKNVNIRSEVKQTASGTEVKKAGVSEEIKQNIQTREIEKISEKHTSLPMKYYVIGFALLAGIGYLAYKFIRHQFF